MKINVMCPGFSYLEIMFINNLLKKYVQNITAMFVPSSLNILTYIFECVAMIFIHFMLCASQSWYFHIL